MTAPTDSAVAAAKRAVGDLRDMDGWISAELFRPTTSPATRTALLTVQRMGRKARSSLEVTP